MLYIFCNFFWRCFENCLSKNRQFFSPSSSFLDFYLSADFNSLVNKSEYWWIRVEWLHDFFANLFYISKFYLLLFFFWKMYYSFFESIKILFIFSSMLLLFIFFHSLLSLLVSSYLIFSLYNLFLLKFYWFYIIDFIIFSYCFRYFS